MKNLNRKNIAGVWSATPTLFTNELKLDREAVPQVLHKYLYQHLKSYRISVRRDNTDISVMNSSAISTH